MSNGGFIDITMTGADGVAILQRRIATYELRLDDHTEPLTQIGDDILRSNAANFISAGGEFGGGWEPLRPSTIARKRGPGILVESGRLMNSLTVKGAAGNVFTVTPHSLEVGTNITTENGALYPAFHQHGTSKMPVRRVVGWSWNMRQLAVRRFEDWVKQILAQQ